MMQVISESGMLYSCLTGKVLLNRRQTRYSIYTIAISEYVSELRVIGYVTI
jgi:hypothetical protein